MLETIHLVFHKIYFLVSQLYIYMSNIESHNLMRAELRLNLLPTNTTHAAYSSGGRTAYQTHSLRLVIAAISQESKIPARYNGHRST